MKVSNVRYYNELDFEQYATLPGISFSSLKGKVTPTPAMAIGTDVHNYLLEPEKYNYHNHDIVKPIAGAICKIVDPALFQCEVSIVANFSHNGFEIPYKGRIDMLASKRLVIDLKILAGPLAGAIEYFGYANQVSGYCYAAGADRAIIIAYNKSTRSVEMKAITPSAKFWEKIILTHGKIKK